ncbi:MAG: hypothetical protein M3O07_08640 [Pseudomonadota bacterium]|nr:hypothetical protein [Pseudomonadota bacterium]
MVVASLDDGAFRFTRPNGQIFDSPQPLAARWQDLMSDQQIQITPQTAISSWTGEELDVDLAVDWLLRHGERVKSVSAETHIP